MVWKVAMAKMIIMIIVNTVKLCVCYLSSLFIDFGDRNFFYDTALLIPLNSVHHSFYLLHLCVYLCEGTTSFVQ